MTNIKITDLTAYTDAASTDVLPIVDVVADVTKKIAISDIVKAVPQGTAALPGLAFDGDFNTGIYSPDLDKVAISTAGAGRLFVDANGNVGINESAPSNYGSGADNLVVRSSGSAGISIISTGAFENGSIIFGDPTLPARGKITYANTFNRLSFFANSNEVMQIGSDGKVSIAGGSVFLSPAISFSGSAPASSLVVSGTGNVSTVGTMTADSFIPTSSTVPTNGVYLPSANNVAISTNGTGRLFVDASGNVGVGATPTNYAGYVNFVNNGSSGATYEQRIAGVLTGALTTDSQVTLASIASIPLIFATANTERLRITSDGKLGVGTSTPNVPLQVIGSSTVTDPVIRATNSGGTQSMALMSGGLRMDGGVPIQIYQGGSEVARIDTSGRLGIGTTSPSSLLSLGGSATAQKLLVYEDGANSRYGFGIQPGEMRSFAASSGVLTFGHVSTSDATTYSEKARIDSSGRLGLGTSSPVTPLDISAASSAVVRASTNSNTTAGMAVSTDGNTTDWFFGSRRDSTGGTVGTDRFNLLRGTSAYVTVNTSGNVGIGTTSVSSQLHIVPASDDNFTNGLRVSRGAEANQYGMFNYSSGALNIIATDSTVNVNPITRFLRSTDGSTVTESMRITSSGQLLVGTSSSYSGFTKTIEIAGTTSTDQPVVAAFNFNNATADQAGYFNLYRSRGASVGTNTIVENGDYLGYIQFLGANGSGYNTAASIRGEVDGTPGASNDMPGRLVFSTTADGASSPTERMRITSGGICAFSNGSIAINGSAIASGAGNSTLKYNTSTGIVTYDTSTRLVKENIVDCPYGLNEVKLLQPRKYFRTDDCRNEIGFVADELVNVLPEFVPIGPKSVITKNEEDTEDIPLGVNYEKLTAVLTKALQEAIGRIETLEAEVAALKAK